MLLLLLLITIINTVIIVIIIIFGRSFVKRFALCYRTVVCVSLCLVTLVYCGQTAGWIKMPLGAEVGLGPGHIVLDGDPAAHRKGHISPFYFRPCLLRPNGRPSQQQCRALVSYFNKLTTILVHGHV